MKAKPLPQPGKPLKVTRGSVSVKVYVGNNVVNGTSYPQFTVVYSDGIQRKKKRFADLETAKREAEVIATALANGENAILKLTSEAKTIHVRAVEAVRPFGIPLDVAALEYAEVRGMLPANVSLKEAVQGYLRRNPATLPQKSVREVVTELLEVKRRAGRSIVHTKDIEHRLGRFADAFQMPISQITGATVESYIHGLGVSRRTQVNHLRLITSLFKFAVRRKYLTNDSISELEAIERPEEEQTEIEIFTPDELREILSSARPELLPWIAISAFSGLRSAELSRLDWAEVNLPQRHIEVTAAKSKTASRRLAPVPDCLVAWLSDRAKESGPVTPFANMAKQIDWLVSDVNNARKTKAEEAGNDRKTTPKFVWKRNGLRHSFVSYRVAQIQNVAQVALEAGNSPQMIFQHYRQLVSEAEAARWFAIVPQTEANIVALKTEVAA